MNEKLSKLRIVNRGVMYIQDVILELFTQEEHNFLKLEPPIKEIFNGLIDISMKIIDLENNEIEVIK